MQRSTSKGSQADLSAEATSVLNEIIEETFEKATQPDPTLTDEPIPPGELQSEKLKQLGSRPNSPGVDPRKAMPISAEDAANLREPLVAGLGSHDGPPHKALTAHLPPQDVQERHFREVAEARQRLSINTPTLESGRSVDPVSSPGSTSHSATTPAVHDTSADTSPESAARFEGDRDDEPQTPVELKETAAEVAEKARHDCIHQAQLDIARSEILRSSPIAPDDQLQAEERAAREREARQQVDDSQAESGIDSSQEKPEAHT